MVVQYEAYQSDKFPGDPNAEAAWISSLFYTLDWGVKCTVSSVLSANVWNPWEALSVP